MHPVGRQAAEAEAGMSVRPGTLSSCCCFIRQIEADLVSTAEVATQ